MSVGLEISSLELKAKDHELLQVHLEQLDAKVDPAKLVKFNPFLGSFITGDRDALNPAQREALELAIAKAFLVPDHHFFQVSKDIEKNSGQKIDPADYITLADLGMIGDTTISRSNGKIVIVTQVRLTTVICPTKSEIKSQVKERLKKYVAAIKGLENADVEVKDQYETAAERYMVSRPKGLVTQYLAKSALRKTLKQLNSEEKDPEKMKSAYLKLRIKLAKDVYYTRYKGNAAYRDHAVVDVRVRNEWCAAWLPVKSLRKFELLGQARVAGFLPRNSFIENFAFPAMSASKAYGEVRKAGNFAGLESSKPAECLAARRDAFSWTSDEFDRFKTVKTEDMLAGLSFGPTAREGVLG